MSRFKHPVSARWFDPSTGAYITVAGNFGNRGISYFTPPSFTNAKGYDDWVLVL